ncbi:hypothetical protein R3P38DRAFT_1788164 [Favolaschia claudopus]|uniref:Uncharacterized protein n=1 Tax=Favolaschia claudopus TaxID=2862362 RepID=A0AAW0A5V7_9AGAR
MGKPRQQKELPSAQNHKSKPDLLRLFTSFLVASWRHGLFPRLLPFAYCPRNLVAWFKSRPNPKLDPCANLEQPCLSMPWFMGRCLIIEQLILQTQRTFYASGDLARFRRPRHTRLQKNERPAFINRLASDTAYVHVWNQLLDLRIGLYCSSLRQASPLVRNPVSKTLFGLSSKIADRAVLSITSPFVPATGTHVFGCPT